MHLAFREFQASDERPARFGIHEKNELVEFEEEMLEDFSKFENTKEKMERYMEIRRAEKEMAKSRSSLLKEIKEDFKRFMPTFENKNPEYFI